MPTVLQVYSNHQSNSLLCRTVEFICKQFYVLHRKPFVLQMLGSIAPMLDLNTDLPFADANKVSFREVLPKDIYAKNMTAVFFNYFYHKFQYYDLAMFGNIIICGEVVVTV